MSQGSPGAETVLKVIGALHKLDDGDSSPLEGLGGPEGMKKELLKSLGSEDPIVRSGAAMLIGIVGDKKLAPNIAELLDKKPGPASDDVIDRVKEGADRFAAGIALGLLGATEYAPRLVESLRSDDKNMRTGAAMGLGAMGAKEHAKAIAALLKREDKESKAAAVGVLAQLDAKEYASEIAKLASDRKSVDSDINKLAAYALAKLGAREHAASIAGLLDEKSSKRAAAMALALLDATEYAPRIAKLLSDESSLVRKDALLSLGLMRADEYVKEVAAALDDEEEFVVSAAAFSLLLLDADAYADRIIKIIDETHKGRVLLPPSDVPLPKAHAQALKRANASFARMRLKRSGREE
jgi:HEAT repeat protein